MLVLAVVVALFASSDAKLRRSHRISDISSSQKLDEFVDESTHSAMEAEKHHADLEDIMTKQLFFSLPPVSPPVGSVSTNSPTVPAVNETEAPSVSIAPSATPNANASAAPTVEGTTAAPTTQACGISSTDRALQILAILDAAATDTSLLRNPDAPQGLATDWIINQDVTTCPDEDTKILQRWSLAVMYFATGGDEWFACSAGDDNCGNSFSRKVAFLNPESECEWAGISCIDGCVTEIEFGTCQTEVIGVFSLVHCRGKQLGGYYSY